MNPLDTLRHTPPEPASPPLSMDPLIADVRTAMADAEALLKATAHVGGEAMDGLRARARDSLHAANLQLANAQQAMTRQARDAAKATNRYVHEHPWTAIGIGAGLGLVAGVLLRRR